VPATTGQGNPKWTREETILALHLYFLCEGKAPSKTDPRVVSLSEELRARNPAASQVRANFRNPDGVVFKLQNLRSVATGKGFHNASSMDREVWEELGRKSEMVACLAREIRGKKRIHLQSRTSSVNVPGHASAFLDEEHPSDGH
jgi:5-methylcytosine-specific restriction enzyme A